jgi:hypothetical protein
MAETLIYTLGYFLEFKLREKYHWPFILIDEQTGQF